MSDILQAILLGIIQGITEWLPVSSSGHLVILQHFLKIEEPLALDIMLHIGTALVVFFIFRKKILSYLKGAYHAIKDSIKKKTEGSLLRDKDSSFFIKITVALIPAVFVGLVFRNIITDAFGNILFVSIALLVTGFILFLTRFRHEGSKEISYLDALMIGVAQSIAIFPGISRSGTTIAAALLIGIRKEKAAEFSFLLFIPTMLGAALLNYKEILTTDIFTTEIILGTLIAMIISFFAIEFLLRIIKKGKLHNFSYYCFGIGLLLLSYSLFLA